MNILIRLVAVIVTIYGVSDFVASVPHHPTAGAVAGDILWYGFWVLLGIALWRRARRPKARTL